MNNPLHFMDANKLIRQLIHQLHAVYFLNQEIKSHNV